MYSYMAKYKTSLLMFKMTMEDLPSFNVHRLSLLGRT